MKNFIPLLFLFFGLSPIYGQPPDIRYDAGSVMIDIAVEKLNKVIGDVEATIFLVDASNESRDFKKSKIATSDLGPEGYKIVRKERGLYVIGGDEKGLMYGILDVRDQLRLNPDLGAIEEKVENPRFDFRAVKFNLPWSSYRQGESLQLHMETVKDTVFWESFLDMMADNRFNALTLWNLHPFTFMIQPKAFPEAIQFTGQEFTDWQIFYRTLFRMCKDRGIDTYIINWNIIVSPGMTETHNVANYKDDLEWHYGFTPADTSQIIIDYMRECITQVINEYPNLTGVGVSLGERMKMPVADAMQWVKETFVEGIQNAERPARFIHRAPFKVAPDIARDYIESYDFPEPIIMEFKFNWSHAHSSPHLSITHGGKVKDGYWNPEPPNYEMAWMMRNEDFIMLNWGNPDFIRKHIDVNGQDFVAGYFIGSETYIPAKEYRMRPEVAYDWKYAFEKQWEFYQMWGRLLYNPQIGDQFFIDQFKLRYGKEAGEQMFEALALASEMPLELASFYQGTWDFTLYAEGFLNGKQLYRNYKESTKAFINVKEMITHPTLDQRYLNIDTYTNRKLEGGSFQEEEVTPFALADRMQANGEQIIKLCAEVESKASANQTNFQVEMVDVKTWAYLSLYFAEKLRGGICLDEAVKTSNQELQQKSIDHLKKAGGYWDDIIATAEQNYDEVSLLHIKTTKFSWRMFRSQVWKDVEIAAESL